MTTAVEVEAPSVVDGLSAEAYHADHSSISSSGLRQLLKPGCPAQFKWDRDHPAPPKKTFDLGHAAHTLALGDGPELVVVEGVRWDTKAAKEEVAEVRARGAVPLKQAEMDQVRTMADALREDPLAGPLLAGPGIAERSIFWTDPATGIRCRVRPDWLLTYPDLTLCVDYKTCVSAEPEAVSRAIRDHAYHQQDALYIDGITAATSADSVRFLFIFQSKTAPYLVTVRELAQHDRDIGRARNEHALRLYADCLATDTWPTWTGPTTDIPQISMPSWDVIRQTEEYLP
ncbi:PD-(D/E)XK nuclease-like domain-containing protein [Streptomyces sp. WAC00276]|uniref:PD-(D/E)XK nuclease-like domain-containing protein n=1 Tax=Streptomyces sp. WAC00276 TaxID=2933778 RepID=UPI001FFE71AF|nr:PD-(D/E)XK nuclease-like domain-containing protein [Streptomyces sp. WAC00276]MCK2144853.1 PD-(D/E)XK nuclease-like domain-containing protein [Streptomyces sp. WAC00276]